MSLITGHDGILVCLQINRYSFLMSLRYFEDGPTFPNELLDQLMAGEVVFLCGAGVSFPQLPGFKDLVEETFDRLGLEMDAGEQIAFEGNRYEEVLGSVARRLVHPKKMYEAVKGLLTPVERPDLSRHNTLLRLSMNLDNRYCLVTTNFDPLFERAVAAQKGEPVARKISVAGQALPAPGAEDFDGIIHLHGRHEDVPTGIKGTPLVLTSAEYGDAYMRSGWASRFLFDLARCKTIVLVGYSASDAPVRYFLNILEADRERFQDLRTVYAFDGVDDVTDEADARWSTVAVHPITYQRGTEGLPSHGTLWRDLESLADLIERPKPTRRRMAEVILSKSYGAASAIELEQIGWLLKGRGDLWDIVITKILDPAWFDHFSRQELWQLADPTWVLPQWFANRWTDLKALRSAAQWCNKSSVELIEKLETHLRRRPRPPELWFRAWQLLVSCNLHRISLRRENGYQLAGHIGNGRLIDLDLQRAVDSLTPALMIEPPFWEDKNASAAEPQTLREMYEISFRTMEDDVEEVLNALLAKPNLASRLAELATEALRSSIYLARDSDLITEHWDSLDRGLPSIAAHVQNYDHGGVIHLIRLLTDLLPALVQQNPLLARSLAEQWRALPSALGMRLWLYVLRNREIFTVDEVIADILALPSDDFWAQRPELFALIEDRFSEATAAQIEEVVTRIADQGPTLFADKDDFREGETDWRPDARDHAMWIRLSTIKSTGALTEIGEALLEAIYARTSYLNRDPEERDLFTVYSSGVHAITGDPAPLLQAEPEDRLELAHTLLRSNDFDERADWRAYCHADPKGAFLTLSRQGARNEDVELWRDLIGSLAFPIPPEPEKQRERSDLFKRIFRLLEPVSDSDISPLLNGLVDVLHSRVDVPAQLRNRWWDRLWRLAVAAEGDGDRQETGDGRFYDRVINSAAGKLAEDLLRSIEQERQAAGSVSRANIIRLRRIVAEPSFAGHLARGACAQSVGFLIYIDESFVRRRLLPWINGEGRTAATLRAVVAEWASLGAVASRVLKAELLKAAQECKSTDWEAQHVAAKILWPVLAPLLNDNTMDWGFQASDTRRALRLCPDAVRTAAMQCLAIWQKKGFDLGPAEAWRRGLGPLFEQVWPQERQFKNARLTTHLAHFCVNAADEFPNALRVVKPYLSVIEGKSGNLFFLHDSDLPKRFPEETLEFLWRLFRKRTETYGSPELATTLDAIRAARPLLEIDRRFQWLESKAIRFA